HSERALKAVIRESDVMIYAVGTYDQWVHTEEERLGPDLLRDVSELTGGQAFTLSDANEMPAVTHRIGSQLRHQYMLAYQPQPAPHDGKWHRISVKLRLSKSLPILKVQAKMGYYAAE